MSEEKTELKITNTAEMFYHKIGSTTYNVSLNFSNTSKENINDKIIRLINNENRGTDKTVNELSYPKGI